MLKKLAEGASGEGEAEKQASTDDDVVDAEFEEVKDDKEEAKGDK